MVCAVPYRYAGGNLSDMAAIQHVSGYIVKMLTGLPLLMPERASGIWERKLWEEKFPRKPSIFCSLIFIGTISRASHSLLRLITKTRELVFWQWAEKEK